MDTLANVYINHVPFCIFVEIDSRVADFPVTLATWLDHRLSCHDDILLQNKPHCDDRLYNAIKICYAKDVAKYTFQGQTLFPNSLRVHRDWLFFDDNVLVLGLDLT